MATSIEQSELAVIVGPRAGYYLPQFEKIRAGGGQWVGTWNWAAFFLSSAWFAYRGMPGLAILNLAAPWLTFLAASMIGASTNSANLALALPLAYIILAYAGVPTYANSLYYQSLKKQVAKAATEEQLPKPPGGLRFVFAAVAGIIAFGIPAGMAVMAQMAFSEYGNRANVSEAISLLSSAKTPVAEYYADKNKWPDSLDQVVERTKGTYTESVAITNGAGAASGPLTITATMKTTGVRPSVAGKTVQLRTEDGKAWVCSSGETNGVPIKYLPGSCR